MARAIDANELEMFPYSEVAGTEEQIADWIEQVGLSGDDTASRARNLCWKVIEGFINVVKTQPTLTQPNEWVNVEDRMPEPGSLIVYADVCIDEVAYGVLRVPQGKCHKVYNYWMCLSDRFNRRPPEGEEET